MMKIGMGGVEEWRAYICGVKKGSRTKGELSKRYVKERKRLLDKEGEEGSGGKEEVQREDGGIQGTGTRKYKMQKERQRDDMMGMD